MVRHLQVFMRSAIVLYVRLTPSDKRHPDMPLFVGLPEG